MYSEFLFPALPHMEVFSQQMLPNLFKPSSPFMKLMMVHGNSHEMRVDRGEVPSATLYYK